MKAKDLLQAMNDIDTKYVAEAQPWTAPVKKLHHPVWAAAAAVMLCLGLGAGAAVMLHSPAVQPGAEGGVTTELSSSQEAGGAISELDVNLEFAQLTPEEYSEKFITFLNEYQEVAVAPANLASGGTYGGERLTGEETAAIWGGALPWDETIYTEATAHYAQDGTLVEVEVNGYTGEVEEVASDLGAESSGPDAATGPYQLFSVTLIPQSPTGDWGAALEATLAEANNQAVGVPVAAGTTTQTLEYVLEDDTTQSLEHTACRAVYTSQGLTVSVSAFSTGEQLGTFTPGEAQAFVEQVVGQSLNTGVVLSGLSAPQDGTDTALEFAQWDEAEYETLFREWADSYRADVIEPQVTKPDGSYRTQDLPLEQVKALWGGEFPWVNGHDSFQNPRAYTYHTEEGEPVYAVIEIGGGDVGFTVTILPQYPQGEWGEALTAVLAQANEEVNGVPVLTSGTQLSTAAYTKYEALFQPQSSDSVIHVEAHAGDTQSDFTPGEAQAFVEQVVEGTLTGGIDLTVLQP